MLLRQYLADFGGSGSMIGEVINLVDNPAGFLVDQQMIFIVRVLAVITVWLFIV